jgi:iron complex outermembrane receptor protein
VALSLLLLHWVAMTTRSRSPLFWALLLLFLNVLAAPLPAPAQQASSSDLTQMNLEDLMKVEVTSVSRQQQSLSSTAAAVFVISQDDIQRSGANNIPDLLRMVPGLQVAQINANSWAISARGMNGLFSNELMVMVDGRTVYVPTFGGVFWDALDLPLEDIARIEVIRGPTGTIWGANAVNGLINIITKKAGETQGAMVVAGAGGTQREFSILQYGGQLPHSIDYRVYAKYFNNESLDSPGGGSMGDGWHSLRGGFRIDASLSAGNTLTFQGDVYSDREGAPTSYLYSLASPAPSSVNLQEDFSGGFFQTVWTHTISKSSSLQFGFTLDRYARMDAVGETRDTLDFELQHNFSWGARQNIVWGLDYRYTTYNARGSLLISLQPSADDHNLYSGFVQDEIALLPRKVYLTLGTRVEQNYYAGLLAMPSARLAWTPDANNTFWCSVGLGVRTPAETDVGERLNLGGFSGPGGTLTELSQVGNPNFQPENLVGYDAGYRANLNPQLSFDLAAYFDLYDHQSTYDPGALYFEPSPLPHLVLPLIEHNSIYGEAHGLEISTDWRVTDRWILSPSYTFEVMHMHLNQGSFDVTDLQAAQGSNPNHSAVLRSHYALPHALSWEVSAFYVGRLADPVISSYTRLDTQLSWQWKEGVTLSVVGQNLLKRDHLEFVDDTRDERSAFMQRSAYAKLTWHF